VLSVFQDLPECSKCLLELSTVQLVVAVKVHPFENVFEGADTDSALLLNEELELKV